MKYPGARWLMLAMYGNPDRKYYKIESRVYPHMSPMASLPIDLLLSVFVTRTKRLSSLTEEIYCRIVSADADEC